MNIDEYTRLLIREQIHQYGKKQRLSTMNFRALIIIILVGVLLLCLRVI
jgi:hypothetical protein